MMHGTAAGQASSVIGSESPAPPITGLKAFLIPSIGDVIFITFSAFLAPLGSALLKDAGVGWHLRNGELILKTGTFTRVDPFSYTMAGKPWFAWEWLFDVTIALLYRCGGLVAICIATALLFGACFAGLYWLLNKRSNNPIIAAALVIMAALASYIHVLARPHVASWLFVLITIAVLSKAEEDARYLFVLAPLIVLWTNVHGSFFIEVILIAIFGIGGLIDFGKARLRRIGQYSAAMVACSLASLVNPYGYQLHLHVADFLSNPYYRNQIGEYLSPDFHEPFGRWFMLLIALTVTALACCHRKVPATDLLLTLFALSSGLFSTRSVPASAIILSFVSAPLLAASIGNRQGSGLFERASRALLALATDTAAIERQVRAHTWTIVAAVLFATLAFTGGSVGSHKFLAAEFPDRFPTAAATILQNAGISEGVFAFDQWGSYLIYRLYPRFRVLIDDRADLFGQQRMEEMVIVAEGRRGWKGILDRDSVNYALVPPECALASILRIAPGWSVMYEDRVAVLFQRKHPLPSN